MPQRKTLQTTAVLTELQKRGHATNQEIARALRLLFPAITTTTVHRITKRLVDEGVIAYAPSFNEVKVLDATPTHHDHFYCQGCSRLVDIHLTDAVIATLQAQLPSKLSRQNIAISGICETCQ